MVLEAQAVHLVEYLVRLAAGEEISSILTILLHPIIISACALETSQYRIKDLWAASVQKQEN